VGEADLGKWGLITLVLWVVFIISLTFKVMPALKKKNKQNLSCPSYTSGENIIQYNYLEI
jgi:hypothetical protein